MSWFAVSDNFDKPHESTFEPFNYLITFSDSVIYGHNEIDEIGDVCLQNPSDEDISLYPYTFTSTHESSDYTLNNIDIPREICHENSQTSIDYHMPGWNYHEFNKNQQQQFIAKYFPERLGLYKSYCHDQQRTNLFAYLWLYMNGGIYISQDYKLLKSIEPILSKINSADLYFMFDNERYISPKFICSQPFCEFG